MAQERLIICNTSPLINLGILAAAKARGKIDALAPVLQALKNQARFWISPQLERLLLEEAGEIR